MAAGMKFLIFIVAIFFLIITYYKTEAGPYRGYNYGYYGSDETRLNTYLKKVLDPLKEQMKTGIPQFGLPVLDPLDLGNISKSFNNEKVNSSLFIQNLVISGLSNFTLYKLDAHLRNLTVVIRVVFHKVMIDSERYILSGMAAKIFPLIGDGRMSIHANDVEVTISLTFSFPSSGNARIEDVVLDMDFRQASVYFENLFGGGSLGDVINAYLSTSGKKLYNTVKPKLLTQASEFIKERGNEALSKFNLGKLSLK
ncbi:uncharacterized protein [Centruroides vittatus]|uniref:uncharacterized protein n=1 Tax=Centruroides vittatus TaxID=120091 RepID=UPI00350F32C2